MNAVRMALLSAALLLAGCATRTNPADPAVYRPAAPISYPLPR